MTRIRFRINGEEQEDDVQPQIILVDYLRTQLGLTAAKIGCETAQCGSCTISMNGMSAKSCTVLAVQADGADIVTLEGLSPQGHHPLQQAFHEAHGIQCGYCTSGMIMAAYDLCTSHEKPTLDAVRAGLRGNLCRCTGYENIIRAVLAATEAMPR